MIDQAEAGLLVLASGSRTRYEMLRAAGLLFTVEPADVDEAALKAAMKAEGQRVTPRDVAVRLAAAKAEAVSSIHPERLVIGADQVLDLDGEMPSKPACLDEARELLLQLRGRSHQLHSGVALAEGGRAVWQASDTAELTVRAYSNRFLETYLARGGASLCQSAGAYQIEGLGLQLFERVRGDHFTILGLPLLKLLAELRIRGAIVA